MRDEPYNPVVTDLLDVCIGQQVCPLYYECHDAYSMVTGVICGNCNSFNQSQVIAYHFCLSDINPHAHTIIC